MALINYSPWADAANVGSGLGASLTNLLIELPKIRQQQALLQAHQQLYGAQAGLYQAEAERNRAQIPTYQAQVAADTARAGTYNAERDLYSARAKEIGSVEMAKERLGNALRQIPSTLAAGGSIDPLIADVVDNMARLPHADRASLGESLAQMLEMSKPKFRTNLGLGNKGDPFNVPAGATAIDPSVQPGQPGQIVYQSPRTTGYGQDLVDPATKEVIASGRDRPLGDAIHSGVFGAAARGYFDPFATDAKKNAILESIPQFLQALPGQGMPTKAPPMVPGRKPAQGGAVNPRYNPATGQVEKYDPATGRWIPQ